MIVIQYFENKSLIFSHLVENFVASVGDIIIIKGRKADILSVNKINGDLIQVHFKFHPVIKKPSLVKDTKKKRR
ncbi:hypothetical protein [Bacillus sp. B15-48]|uniref:hypothetical protein n=1 Tax=Bacillus sp. B15-48 TaxID=1548601 RepID=UPI00193F4601|nr:hypothetical protein [Bacillus sp. B15-48]MBM4763458.1 hypothetical protein [Bacillus sp. B15-48]